MHVWAFEDMYVCHIKERQSRKFHEIDEDETYNICRDRFRNLRSQKRT